MLDQTPARSLDVGCWMLVVLVSSRSQYPSDPEVGGLCWMVWWLRPGRGRDAVPGGEGCASKRTLPVSAPGSRITTGLGTVARPRPAWYCRVSGAATASQVGCFKRARDFGVPGRSCLCPRSHPCPGENPRVCFDIWLSCLLEKRGFSLHAVPH